MGAFLVAAPFPWRRRAADRRAISGGVFGIEQQAQGRREG
jgi:hypothetical protein